jgi:hypothetical protein
MARAIRSSDWLNVEEDERRGAYWQYLVKQWLWRDPFVVVQQPVSFKEDVWDAPTPEALQDFGYIKVPESQISH